MKYVASLFSGSQGLRARTFLSSLACICVILPLAIMAGCSEDEETITFPTPPPEVALDWYLGISGTAANDIYACGRNGNMFHFNGTSWTKQSMGVSTDIIDIQNLDGVMYAVGHKGNIWKNSGSSWSAMTSGTTEDLFGIGKFQNSIYACGFEGTLLKLSGSSWSSIGGTLVMRDASAAPTDTLRMDRDIYSLVTIGNNFIGGSFIVDLDAEIFGTLGTKGMILSKDKPQEDEETIFDWWLRPLSGAELIENEWIVSSISDSTTPARNFLGTSEGYLFQMQVDANSNENWIKDPARISQDVNNGISDMYLAPNNKLYMVTDDGLIVVRDEDGTATVLYDQISTLSGIWGTGSDNLYIVGYMENEIYHAVHDLDTNTLEITTIALGQTDGGN